MKRIGVRRGVALLTRLGHEALRCSVNLTVGQVVVGGRVEGFEIECHSRTESRAAAAAAAELPRQPEPEESGRSLSRDPSLS